MRNHCPIEGEDAHAQASGRSKQGIGNHIVGSDPAQPVEHAQSCKKITRNPVPKETASNGDEKKALPSYVAYLLLAVVFVEGVEEGAVRQNTWPNHTERPDYELAKKPSETKAEALRTNSQENLEAHWDGLTIEDTLREDDIR